jgi:hypothetical protein
MKPCLQISPIIRVAPQSHSCSWLGLGYHLLAAALELRVRLMSSLFFDILVERSDFCEHNDSRQA